MATSRQAVVAASRVADKPVWSSRNQPSGWFFYACANVDQAQDIEQKEFFGRLASS
jgi:hypothetical protein